MGIQLMSRSFLPVPIGSIPIAVIRLEWADFTKTSPCTTHLDGSTNCKHSPPFRSPSLTTSSARPANRHLEIAVTAKVSEFLQFDGFGRERCKRGTERKCGNSLCATKCPRSENRSDTLNGLCSSSTSGSLLHAQRKKWKMPWASIARHRSGNINLTRMRGACGPGGGANKCTQ